jgi:guanosine-3',5'-bis(diphosphate) 3'-pyrophosphohydrolase
VENIVINAERIARKAHEQQRRKYGSQEPYIVHPAKVAAKVASLPGTTDEDIAAAWLHDVIEDIALAQDKYDEYCDLIRHECGEIVLQLVLELTNPTESPEWKDRSRAEKRAKDWEHLAGVSDRARRIKLVDRWANVLDFEGAPPRMIEKYVPESRHLLGMCRSVDETMAAELEAAIDRLAARILQG